MMKKGISLIVLVITIIVMIILAASVVITLSNTGIINRASHAVDLTNESQVQDLAALIWADAYMNNLRGTALETKVKNKLKEQGIEDDNWNITVTDTGISVINKKGKVGLGMLITAEDYGKTVDYSVTVAETTYSKWQIYYHNDDYVYIISESIGKEGLGDFVERPQGGYVYVGNGDVLSLSSDQLTLYKKFKLGQDGYILDSTKANSDAVAYLITKYANFANKTEKYSSYVEGAIGAPTIELLAAGWNAWNEAKKLVEPSHTYTALTLSSDATWTGYMVNGEQQMAYIETDGFYMNSKCYYWLASPSAYYNGNVLYSGGTYVGSNGIMGGYSIRPVVCLKASIPAKVGTGDYDFELVK